MAKKRRKAYKPRETFAPPLVLGWLHPTGGKEHIDYDLASLIPLMEIEAGRGKAEHFCAVRLAIKEGAVLAKHFEDSPVLEVMSLIGGIAIDQAYRMAVEAERAGKPKRAPLKCLTQPARYAIELICDMERMISGVTLAKVTQETVRRKADINRYHPDAAWIVDPEKPESYEAILGPEAGRGCAFVNGYPRCGHLDVIDGQLHYVMPVEDMHARITEPILIVLAVPKKKGEAKDSGRH